MPLPPRSQWFQQTTVGRVKNCRPGALTHSPTAGPSAANYFGTTNIGIQQPPTRWPQIPKSVVPSWDGELVRGPRPMREAQRSQLLLAPRRAKSPKANGLPRLPRLRAIWRKEECWDTRGHRRNAVEGRKNSQPLTGDKGVPKSVGQLGICRDRP